MALLDDLKSRLDRLASKGWAKLFEKHGLDITISKSKLAAELTKTLSVKRDHPGFEEFALDGIQGVQPGDPGRSLLYHAFASPDVAPLKAGTLTDADFPTLDDLDVIENYIYSVAQRTLSFFKNPIVAVFAYQYRGKRLSTHRKHADLAFSRTGIARVGTEAMRYDGASRAFNPLPAAGARGFATLPARYAAFIAEYRSPKEGDAVLRAIAGVDDAVPFLFPIHKLFAGDECLWQDPDGKEPLVLPSVKFVELHVNEKLARIHRKGDDNPGRVAPLPQFDITAPPFVRTSKDSTDLVRVVHTGASILVSPVPNPLVRTARQAVGNGSEMVRFRVPKEIADVDSTDEIDESNRFWTSLRLRDTDAGRAAPEYANIRQEVMQTASGAFRLKDLNLVPEQGTAPAQRFAAKLAKGGYEAAHFVDSTCDGAVSVVVPPALGLDVLPAFSLVAAVDYFPKVDQVEIEEWLERMQGKKVGLANATRIFPQGGPKPLSDGRFEVQQLVNKLVASGRQPNSALPDPRPGSSQPAFKTTESANTTATAIVSRRGSAESKDVAAPRSATSWLPDAASDVFAPGWDVSIHNETYVSYGLGSPFPEDAKLCAALNSFWPAVAPDASRTYGLWPGTAQAMATTIPLLDGELGYHLNHPRVVAGEVGNGVGWDGDTGPYLAVVAGQRFVDASDPARADQTRAAFDGTVGFSGLDRIDSAEMIRRIEDHAFCRRLLKAQGFDRAAWLVVAEQVADWSAWTSAVWPRAKASMTGSGYIFVFAQVGSAPIPEGDPPLRQRFEVKQTVEIQLSRARVCWRKDAQAFTESNR